MSGKKLTISSKISRLSHEINNELANGTISEAAVKELLNRHFGQFYKDYTMNIQRITALERLAQAIEKLDDKSRMETGLIEAKPKYMMEYVECNCCNDIICIGELAVEALEDEDFKTKYNKNRDEIRRSFGTYACELREVIPGIAYLKTRKQAEFKKIRLCEKCARKLIKDASEITKTN